MLRWLQKAGPESAGLTEIHTRFLQMLADGRHIFDAAANCVLGGGDPEVIRENLYRTDKRINLTEQRIRREIVVHGSIHGSATFPALLVMMSLVKDAERIGDYAKNLFELAVMRPDLGPADELRKLVEVKDQVSSMLVRAQGLFETQNQEAAKEFLIENDRLQKYCDAEVERLIRTEGENAAVRVLLHRYIKRVTGHAGNVVTSIVMPVDKLDYFPGKPQSEQ
ncbi:MAG: PhoU domain-containing protein [Planctomycetota bacterium]